jgi:hypothetical protein
VIIFWILTLFVGSSAFALIAMLRCRGIRSIERRWLILHERMSPELDVAGSA